MNRVWMVLFGLVVMVSAFLLPSAPVAAQIPGDCAGIDGFSTIGGTNGFVLVIAVEIAEGETISFVIDEISATAAGTMEVDVVDPVEFNAFLTLPGIVEYTAPESGLYIIAIDVTMSPPNEIALVFEIFCGRGGAGGDVVSPPCDNLFDGRLNDNQALDCAAPFALFATEDGGLDIYTIDPLTGDGNLTLRLTSADLTPPEETPAQNYLLAEGRDSTTGQWVQVWWLASGEIAVLSQYADGKPFSVAWPVDDPTQIYHIAW